MKGLAISILFALTLPSGIVLSQTDGKTASLPTEKRSETTGSILIKGVKTDYRAVAGTLIQKNGEGKPALSMSYTAFFKTTQNPSESQRPITFIYNGGPGSASLYLEMGAFGPEKVRTNDTNRIRPPYTTEPNTNSLLDATDMVFIDAPGTGYSKILDQSMQGAGQEKDYYGIDQDGNAFANFIVSFLGRFGRWNSPKFLFGESYGTLRSAVLASILEKEKNVDLNGVILLSQVLNMNNLSDVSTWNSGVDLPYELVLPSLTATAIYQHKIPGAEDKDLEKWVGEAETYAMGPYAEALNKGSELDSTEFNNVALHLHHFTGLPIDYIKKSRLRISASKFQKMLLSDEEKITGRLDSRFTGYDLDPLGDGPSQDPQDNAISGAYLSTFLNYTNEVLKYGKDEDFVSLNYKANGSWDFKHKGSFIPNVIPDLAQAILCNPRLKVMLNMGYYDLATPFYEGWYELHHMPLPENLQKSNIEFQFYRSGHMVYVNDACLRQLHDKIADFIERASH